MVIGSGIGYSQPACNTTIIEEIAGDEGFRITEQIIVPDSIYCSPESWNAKMEKRLCDEKALSFNPKQLILPGAMIGVGVIGVYNPSFRKLNDNIRKGMDRFRGTHYFHADDYIQYLPAVAYLTLDFMKVPSKHNFKERLVTEATAYAVMAAVVNIGKYSFREKRPDTGARNSFPSGHTATAFTAAELMREEYGTWIGVAGYTAATGIAFLRIYNGRHWLNDVIAGAGIGILSARIGYWMLPLYRKWFKWSPRPIRSRCVALMPSYDVNSRQMSICLSMNL